MNALKAFDRRLVADLRAAKADDATARKLAEKRRAAARQGS